MPFAFLPMLTLKARRQAQCDTFWLLCKSREQTDKLKNNNNNNLGCEKQVSFGKQVLGDCLFNKLYQQCSWPASAVCSVEAGRMPSAPLAVLSPGGQQVPDPGPAR